MIGVLSDSHGDIQAFDAAYELLRGKGARRFFFAGGRYEDLDEWVKMRKARVRAGHAYSDQDFLADVTQWLQAGEQVERPPAFFGEGAFGDPSEEKDLDKIRDRFVRTPEKESPRYTDSTVQRKALDMFGDVLCCIVHDKNDLTREDLLNASIFVHGKEAEPKVVQIGPRYFLTPGVLSGAPSPSCGLIELVERTVRFSAFHLDGTTAVEGQTLALGGGKTRLSVK